MEPKIISCPFCGSSLVKNQTYICGTALGIEKRSKRIECEMCGCCGPEIKYNALDVKKADEAWMSSINLWNTRK